MTDLVVDSAYLQDFLERSLAFPTPLTGQRESDPRLRAFLHDLLGAEMSSIGLREVAYDGMGNVCGHLPGTHQDGDGLLLVGFGMTHPAATMTAPFEPSVVDGARFDVDGTVVVGRGAGEQKGPLSAAVAAVEAVLDSGARPRRDTFLIGLASGETGRHDAIRSALDHFRPPVSRCVLVVCTGNDIVVAHKGRVDLSVVVKGRAAHSSSPWLGVNSIEGATAVLERLAALDPGAPDPELGPRTITPTSLETRPRASHTVPSEARLTLDWRLLPGDTPEWAQGLLGETLADLDPFEVEVSVGDHMYPSEVSSGSAVVTELQTAVEAATGRLPELVRISAASDTGFVNKRGIPAVLFGPGDLSRAHTDDDLVSLSDAVDAAGALARMIIA